MRIISGYARGMRLKSPPSASRAIRPTSDRCRESLFSILRERIENARVLDLYAGTGALGIEALSRGAASALFVDFDTISLSLISENLKQFRKYADSHHQSPVYKTLKSDLRKGLDSVITSWGVSHDFDIVFLDPPYGKGLADRTLKSIDRSELMASRCLVIAEEQSKAVLPEKYINLELMDRRKYGDTSFWLYEKMNV